VPQSAEDPVLVSSRREALVVFLIWVSAMAYTLFYCEGHAYGRKAEDIRYIFGCPDWVVWGVALPWGVCVVLSWIFASVFMRDEDLGQDPPGTETDEFGLES
jgi:hypothetical protein